MISKILEKNKVRQRTRIGNDRAYRAAWERFEAVSKRLQKFWKTKKTSASVLREERDW